MLGGVEDSLVKAGVNVAPLKVKKAKQVEPKVITKAVDVVVIGAGMSAVVGVAANNATVIVLEKTDSIGGNTMRAGGGYNYAVPFHEEAQRDARTAQDR